MPAAHAGDFGAAPVYANGINPYGAPTPGSGADPRARLRARVVLPRRLRRRLRLPALGHHDGHAVRQLPRRASGFSPSWLSEDFLPSFTGGVGVGYVWGPAFRTDFTVDIHSIMKAKFTGTRAYNDAVDRMLTVQDKTRFMSTILLMNAYYDIRTGTAVHALRRRRRRLCRQSAHALGQLQPIADSTGDHRR